MKTRPILMWSMLGLGFAGPAMAQQRAVVVPAEASIVVPARGAAQPAPALPVQRPRRVVSDRMLTATRPPESSATSLLVSLPLAIAAGVLAATLGGGGGHGGGVSAPARTR